MLVAKSFSNEGRVEHRARAGLGQSRKPEHKRCGAGLGIRAPLCLRRVQLGRKRFQVMTPLSTSVEVRLHYDAGRA